MSRPLLYLHIGQTKTATTTLQAFCHHNRAWLRERGVLYPASPQDHEVKMKHHHLVESLRAPRHPVAAPWQALARLADEPDTRAVLISDELFWHLRSRQPGRRPAALAWMAEQLRAFEVKVICYLRRQDRWVESWFHQLAKGGQAATARLRLDEFIDHQARSGLLAYERVLADWALAFGDEQLIVRSFETEQLKQGDILLDFFGLLGLPDLEGARRPTDRQAALSRPACLLMNELHRAGMDHTLRNRVRSLLQPPPGATSPADNAADPRRLLSPTHAAGLLAQARAGNAEVARRYRQGAALFTDERLHGEQDHYPALTAGDRAELMAALALAGAE